jgi:hypothetical protein
VATHHEALAEKWCYNPNMTKKALKDVMEHAATGTARIRTNSLAQAKGAATNRKAAGTFAANVLPRYRRLARPPIAQ